MKKIIFAILILSIFSAGCNKQKQAERRKHKNDKVLVKYDGKALYLSEVEDVIPDGINEEDSAARAEAYINQWITNEVLLGAAQDYLADDMDEINRKVEDFKRSLMIHTFKEKLVEQKLDTNITTDAIMEYYEAHKNNFILVQPAVRGFLIKVPIDSDSLGEIKNMIRKMDPQQISDLQKLVVNSKGVFDDFIEKWRYFSDVMVGIPYIVNDPDFFLKNRRYIETQDNKYYYYLRITDFRLTNDVMPLELCQGHIRRIIFNRKSEQLLQELEKTLYNQAIKEDKLKIYY